MSKKIIWKRWEDPISTIIHSRDEDNEEYEKKINGLRGPYIVGSLGVIPLHEGNMPSKLYNFWIAHTNFVITNKVCDFIKGTNGVEVLDIFTPYRCRIGFGLVFNDEDVRKAIEYKLIKQSYPPIKKEIILDKWAKNIKAAKWWIYKNKNNQFMKLTYQEEKDNDDNLMKAFYARNKENN